MHDSVSSFDKSWKVVEKSVTISKKRVNKAALSAIEELGSALMYARGIGVSR
jgi:hypothetical protein